MSLNSNNFTRWNGAFVARPYTITPVDTNFNLYANEDSVVCTPLTASDASNGIDTYSLEVVSINDFSSGFIIGPAIETSQLPYWDGVSELTVYRPIDITLTKIVALLKFKDQMGNYSAQFGCYVNISAVSVSWVEYPVSSVCRLDLYGNANGYQGWTQLKLINSLTLADILPLQLKPNVPSDPDYISDVQNYTLCPPPNTEGYNTLIIGNNSKNGSDPNNFITITSIYLSSTIIGTPPPTALNIPCNIIPGKNQRFNIPAGNYDGGLTIYYTINGNMDTAPTLRFWMINNAGILSGWSSGGITSNPVTNAGVYGNFALIMPPAGSSTITIFCQ